MTPLCLHLSSAYCHHIYIHGTEVITESPTLQVKDRLCSLMMKIHTHTPAQASTKQERDMTASRSHRCICTDKMPFSNPHFNPVSPVLACDLIRPPGYVPHNNLFLHGADSLFMSLFLAQRRGSVGASQEGLAEAAWPALAWHGSLHATSVDLLEIAIDFEDERKDYMRVCPQELGDNQSH